MTTPAYSVATGADDIERPRAINQAHVCALIAVDVRRLGPTVARSTASVLAILLIALVTGAGKTGFVGGLVSGLLFMQPTLLALQLVKDKTDGTLAFLTTLPVTPATLAAVRLVPIVAVSVVGGLLATVLAVQAGVPARFDRHPALATAAILLAATLVPAGLASLVLALSARLRFEALVSLPVVLIFGAVALGKIAERYAPVGLSARLRTLLAQPWLPDVAFVTLVAALFLVLVVAFRVTVRTFEHFTPEAQGG